MTQYEGILRQLIKRPKQGVTLRDLMAICNWPHKRIRELERQGLQIKRVDETKDGVRFRRYILMDDRRAKELLDFYRARRKAA